MPWGVRPVSELRFAFVYHVLECGESMTETCHQFGISRKTGYKWLEWFRQDPGRPLQDRSRRPERSPRRTPPEIERAVLEVRDRYGWGAPKIHAVLARTRSDLPSVRTLTTILRRHGRIQPPEPAETADQRFERTQPNQLWQLDFKGPTEVDRRRVIPFSILDDHSRYLLALRPCLDCTMKTAWTILWDVFGQVGMPEAILADGSFATRHRPQGSLSWFDAHLVRCGIRPIHGRPYHPQTQGKVERLHGTLQRELWPRVRRDSIEHFAQDLEAWRTAVYNTFRPHEALGQEPPLCRWRPSPRLRPDRLPPATYPAGSVIRKVFSPGLIQWYRCRIRVGGGLIGQYVRIEERDGHIAVFFAWKLVRCLAHDQLNPYTVA